MLDIELTDQQRGESMTWREMPCLMLHSTANNSWRQSGMSLMSSPVELAGLQTRKEGFLCGGLLVPLGWRESLDTDDVFPRVLAGDDWEEDDDVVDDDDDDDDEEEEDDDDFFPGDGDEFEDDDDDDDDEDEEEE